MSDDHVSRDQDKLYVKENVSKKPKKFLPPDVLFADSSLINLQTATLGFTESTVFGNSNLLTGSDCRQSGRRKRPANMVHATVFHV